MLLERVGDVIPESHRLKKNTTLPLPGRVGHSGRFCLGFWKKDAIATFCRDSALVGACWCSLGSLHHCNSLWIWETSFFQSSLESKHNVGDKLLINVKTGLVLYVETAQTQTVGFISPKYRPQQCRKPCFSQYTLPDFFIVSEVLAHLIQVFTSGWDDCHLRRICFSSQVEKGVLAVSSERDPCSADDWTWARDLYFHTQRVFISTILHLGATFWPLLDPICELDFGV